jgi:hypothetical protein
MKLGKEINLDLLENYKTKIGTVNNKESKSLYLNFTAWGEILEDNKEQNYNTFLSGVRKKIKQNLNDNIDRNIFYNDRYIVDLDMRTSGFSPTKRSFMACEITLFQKKNLPINQSIIIEHSKNIIYDVINNIFEGNNVFKFHKAKK